MVYGSKRLCLTSSLERPFRCLDFSILLIWLTWYWGLPSQWGARCSTRWGCRPSSLPTPASSTPSIWVCLKFFTCFQNLMHQIQVSFFCVHLLFSSMGCDVHSTGRANKIPSYVSSSLYQYTQYITTVPKWGTPVHFECHSGINIKLEASIKKFSGKTSQFLPNWSFWRIFFHWNVLESVLLEK